MSVRELARFVGKTSATTRAIQAAPLHYRALQSLMNSALPPDTPHLAVEKFRNQVELSPAARKDLTWWSEQASQRNGAPILQATPVLVIESDASNMGWGATNGHEQTGWLWSVEEAAHHINYLELMGTENVCQGSESVHSPVQVRQCNSSDIPESQGWTTLRPSLQTNSGDLGVVSKLGDYTNSRTSPRPGQHNSRLGVQDKSRPE